MFRLDKDIIIHPDSIFKGQNMLKSCRGMTAADRHTLKNHPPEDKSRAMKMATPSALLRGFFLSAFSLFAKKKSAHFFKDFSFLKPLFFQIAD